MIEAWLRAGAGMGRSFPAKEMDFPDELGCAAAEYPSLDCKWQIMQGNCRVMNMYHKKLVKHLLPGTENIPFRTTKPRTRKHFPGKLFLRYTESKFQADAHPEDLIAKP